MTNLSIHPYGPCFAVVQDRSLLVFAVSEANAEDLVQRLSDHPTDEWSRLLPAWLQVPCLFTSVRRHDDMVVLSGADHRGWPVCLPLDNAPWDDFERRHPDRPMPFWACWNLASDALELCSNVHQVPVQPAPLFDNRSWV